MKVAIVGAFDRFNYGDLLFAAVAEHALRTLVGPRAIGFYASVRRDLRRLGGPATRPVSELFRPGELPDGSVIMIAGGEVLDAGWGETLESSASRPVAWLLAQVARWASTRTADRLAQRLSGTPVEWPWILAPRDFRTHVHVVYNSVGGASFDRLTPDVRSRMADKLAEADYLSVRDQRTQALLGECRHNLRAHLAPDCAVLMPGLFPLERLQRIVRAETRELLGRFPTGYLCFQINKRLGEGQGRAIAAQLEAIYRRHGLATVLLPIGRARNHEDHVPLAEVCRHLRTPGVLADGPLAMHDIMYLIASGRAYAGTSLHGAITALAYGAAPLGLTARVPKLEAYFRTWDVPGRYNVALQDLASAMPELLAIAPETLERKHGELVEAAWKNFRAQFEAAGLPVRQEQELVHSGMRVWR